MIKLKDFLSRAIVRLKDELQLMPPTLLQQTEGETNRARQFDAAYSPDKLTQRVIPQIVHVHRHLVFV